MFVENWFSHADLNNLLLRLLLLLRVFNSFLYQFFVRYLFTFSFNRWGIFLGLNSTIWLFANMKILFIFFLFFLYDFLHVSTINLFSGSLTLLLTFVFFINRLRFDTLFFFFLFFLFSFLFSENFLFFKLFPSSFKPQTIFPCQIKC